MGNGLEYMKKINIEKNQKLNEIFNGKKYHFSPVSTLDLSDGVYNHVVVTNITKKDDSEINLKKYDEEYNISSDKQQMGRYDEDLEKEETIVFTSEHITDIKRDAEKINELETMTFKQRHCNCVDRQCIFLVLILLILVILTIIYFIHVSNDLDLAKFRESLSDIFNRWFSKSHS